MRCHSDKFTTGAVLEGLLILELQAGLGPPRAETVLCTPAFTRGLVYLQDCLKLNESGLLHSACSTPNRHLVEVIQVAGNVV